GIDPSGRIYVLDLWRGQTTADVWVEALCDLVERWRPIGWAEEAGQIRASVAPFLDARLRARGAYLARQEFAPRGEQETRAGAMRGRMAVDGLYLPATEWMAALRIELLAFPRGRHDDQVDALGLVGRLVAVRNK